MEIVIVLILSCVLFWYIYKIKHKKVNDFKSPPGLFFFGNILEMASVKDRLKTFLKYVTNYGPTVKINVGPYYDVILTVDYKLINFILSNTKETKKSVIYQFLQPWLQTGLLITEDHNEWKHTRKILTPTFNVDILKNYVKVFESVGDELIAKTQKLSDSNNLDLWELMHLCTLDVICQTSMATNIEAQKGGNTYVSNVEEMCRIVTERGTSVLKLKNWSFIFTRDYYRQKNVVKTLHKFTSDVITKRKLSTSDKNQKLSFLDLLVNYRDENGEKLSDGKIRQEVDTFMFAGHDTTAAAICFTLHCLSNHPEIQNEVWFEQKQLFGDNKNPKVTYQDLQNMKQLENVIKESLRLYPSVPLIGRLTTEDLQFEDHVIGRNTNIVLFIYGLHRDPEHFPEPEKFNPDRFNDAINPSTFLPFGGGPKNCIGQKFALLELKSIVGKLVRHFEFRSAVPKHELMLSPEIVLKSLNGVKVGLKQRL